MRLRCQCQCQCRWRDRCDCERFRSRRSSGPMSSVFEGIDCGKTETKKRPRVAPASRIRFRHFGVEVHRFQPRQPGGRPGLVVEIANRYRGLCSRREFGIERDFSLAKGMQFRFRIMDVADAMRARYCRFRGESQAEISGSKGFRELVEEIALWPHLKPRWSGAGVGAFLRERILTIDPAL